MHPKANVSIGFSIICAIFMMMFWYVDASAQGFSGSWGCRLTHDQQCDWNTENWGDADYIPLNGDLNHDGRTDRIVYRPADGNWGCRLTGGGECDWDAENWGNGDYQPLIGDVNGDGKADRILYRPDDGNWGCRLTDGDKCNWDAENWGDAGYQPLVGDLNGDGMVDRILYRAADGDWGCVFTEKTSSTTVQKCKWDAQDWGNEGYTPLIGDVNGDGRADRILYRPTDGNWGCWLTVDEPLIDGPKCVWDAQDWGDVGYIPLIGDIDGDGKTDRILYRPADGDWGCWLTDDDDKCIWDTQDWGNLGHTPLVGDINNDGKVDRMIYGPELPTIPNLVLLYINADNDSPESPPNEADHDLHVYVKELFNLVQIGAVETEGVVLMALDGPGDNDSYLYHIDSKSGSRCEKSIFEDYTCGNRYVAGKNVERFSENFGAPETLAKFVTESIQRHFSAQKIFLSLVGHGGGWSPNKLPGQPDHIGGQPGFPENSTELGGLLWDFHSAPGATSGHALSTTDLGNALQLVKDTTGRTIDLLYLDACLMGMWEVAYELKDSVDYLLASESWSWTSFQYHQHLSVVKATATVEEIGTAWARHEAMYIQKQFRAPYTYSLTKLDQMDELSIALDQLAAALTTTQSIADGQLTDVFSRTDRFDSTQDEQYEINGLDNYADLGHFVEVLIDTFPEYPALIQAAQSVSSTLASAIVANKVSSGTLPPPYPPNQWSWQNPKGLSIYLPLNPNADDWKRKHYHQLRSSEGHHWDDFIYFFWEGKTAPGVPDCPKPCNLPAPPLYPTSEIFLPIVIR